MITQEQIFEDYMQVRKQNPLVLNITNYVAMNFSANVLLAAGASPIMAHAAEEIEEITALSSCLVLNIGTLSSSWVESMLLAGPVAHQNKIPVVFDPVGVGATRFRQSSALEIIKTCRPTIIRGNAAEIGSLCSLLLPSASLKTKSKGVDSLTEAQEIIASAQALSEQLQGIIIISGKIDYIIDANKVTQVFNGDALMTKVTALGCSVTSLVGAFVAVQKNTYQACVSAMSIAGLAGEKAKKTADSPGSFQVQFLDALSNLEREFIFAQAKVK